MVLANRKVWHGKALSLKPRLAGAKPAQPPTASSPHTEESMQTRFLNSVFLEQAVEGTTAYSKHPRGFRFIAAVMAVCL
jgi:hypothetical protein